MAIGGTYCDDQTKGQHVKRYAVGFVFVEFDGPWVLLLRKTRPAWQAGKLNGPGGHIEDGESDIDAMRREFLEEVGYKITDWTSFAVLAGCDPETGEPFEVVFFRSDYVGN